MVQRYRVWVEVVGATYSLPAYAEYDVQVNAATGQSRWSGFLVHNDPIFSLDAGTYEIRGPNGMTSRVLLTSVKGGGFTPQAASFVGSGSTPTAPAAGADIRCRSN